MTSRLARSRTYRQCCACRQLILPGELYCDQRWAPWEQDPDGDPDGWWSQPACRWCAEHYWKHDDGDGWSEDWAATWADEQADRWLRGLDCFEGPPWRGHVREEFTEPYERAQMEATAFMRFLRRFAKGVKPAAIRRVGAKLLAIAFHQGHEGIHALESWMEPCVCGGWPYGVGKCEDRCYLFGPRSLLANAGQVLGL